MIIRALRSKKSRGKIGRQRFLRALLQRARMRECASQHYIGHLLCQGGPVACCLVHSILSLCGGLRRCLQFAILGGAVFREFICTRSEVLQQTGASQDTKHICHEAAIWAELYWRTTLPGMDHKNAFH